MYSDSTRLTPQTGAHRKQSTSDVETTSCCDTGRRAGDSVGGHEFCQQADLAVDLEGGLGEGHEACHAGSHRGNNDDGHAAGSHDRLCWQPCRSPASGLEGWPRLFGFRPAVAFQVLGGTTSITRSSSDSNVIRVCYRPVDGPLNWTRTRHAEAQLGANRETRICAVTRRQVPFGGADNTCPSRQGVLFGIAEERRPGAYIWREA